jgi:energy-coupling factor transporter ATP-binding protein EcfA2
MNIMQEIKSSWKLDAKAEDTDRYFFHVNEILEIQKGEKAFVIGRKGTGKTAIAQYLQGLKEYNTFSAILSFKNFPFNDLYALTNSGFTAPNQYITLWKYLIYCNVARLMAQNSNIDGAVREKLATLYGPEPLEYLQRSIGKWTATDFNFSILGTGAGTKGVVNKNEHNWIERTFALEQVIGQYIDQANYFIVFDELDEDYRYMTEAVRYQNFTDLLTGLFKAVQDIKSVFRGHRAHILPVVFLRDDIYNILEDPDKTKWDDAKIDLDWNVRRLKDLLAFRISRTHDSTCQTSMPFDAAWKSLFGEVKITFGTMQRKRQSVLEYIIKSSHMRPRDFIRYLSECSKIALENGEAMSEAVVKTADSAFSGYLKRELIDEIGGVVPHTQKVFDVLSQIRKQTFTLAEFAAAYERTVQPAEFQRYDTAWILKILYIFSVIGNQPRQSNQTVFKYLKRDAEINFNESFVVHRGLLKSLQIL